MSKRLLNTYKRLQMCINKIIIARISINVTPLKDFFHFILVFAHFLQYSNPAIIFSMILPFL